MNDFCDIREMYCGKHGSTTALYDVCYHDKPKNKIEVMRDIAGVETTEDLIRYIVCDGDPADESCVGHPVLSKRFGENEWQELTLLNISHSIYVLKPDSHELCDFDCGEDNNCKAVLWFCFSKKKPGYDYTQKVEVSDE